MKLFIWHSRFMLIFLTINEVLIIRIIIILHNKLTHRVSPCNPTLRKIQIIIIFFYCYWLLSTYIQFNFLFFYLKFLLSLVLLLKFVFKTLVIFICNCHLNILQFRRFHKKGLLIIFIIQDVMLIICWDNLAIWL